MKPTKVELITIALIIVFGILLSASLIVLSKSIASMENKGGLKNALGELWNGRTNSTATNR